MEISVINIGNSKGIRLPKFILEKYNIQDTIELSLESNQIVLKPIHQARKDWDQSFKMMAESNDDQLLIDDVLSEEDFEEWN